MEISREMVDYISYLSRLEIPEEEKADMQEKLRQIIGYMDILNQVDTEGVEPMSHVIPLKNVLREDVVKPSMDRAELLKNAPVPDDETFLVPKAVE